MCNVINKERRYTLMHYLIGALPARLGDEMSGQSIVLLGLAATGSVVLSSWLLAAITFSAALGGPLLGAMLDRSSYPGRVLSVALALYASGLATLAVVMGYTPTWMVVCLALAAGFFMPSISGGWSSRLKSFTADDAMTRASAIDATTFNIAGLVGPALAGLLTAWRGVYWALATLVVLLLAAIPMAWSLPKRRYRKEEHSTSFRQDIIAGFTVIVTRPALRRITFVSIISYLGIGMLWVIYPLVGKRLLGNAGYGGLLASALSVSALFATIAYAKWPTRYRPDTVAFATTVILAVSMLVLAFASNVLMALVAMVIAGLADGPQLAAIFAVRHREAPERSRSQVFTTGASLKIAAAAIGTITAGQLAPSSFHLTVLVACGVQIAAAFAFLLI